MRRESLILFLPAALAAVTDAVTVCVVTAHQPDYPGRFVVYQVVMCGAALLAAVPNKWVRFVGFVLLIAGVLISMAVGLLYLPTFFAFVWVMTRDERLAPAFVAKGTPQRDETPYVLPAWFASV
jgi:cell division protein FtsW (lipid II flippase)